MSIHPLSSSVACQKQLHLHIKQAGLARRYKLLQCKGDTLIKHHALHLCLQAAATAAASTAAASTAAASTAAAAAGQLNKLAAAWVVAARQARVWRQASHVRGVPAARCEKLGHSELQAAAVCRAKVVLQQAFAIGALTHNRRPAGVVRWERQEGQCMCELGVQEANRSKPARG